MNCKSSLLTQYLCNRLSVKPHAQRRKQLLGIYGFGQIFGRSRLQAFLAVPLHRFCGQSDDRQSPERGVLPDHLHGFIAIHLGHHDVHQYDGDIRGRFELGDCLPSRSGGDHGHAAALNHAAEGKDIAHVVIEVRDRGPGIPVEEQARIFDRFYRVESGLTRTTGGTGLGLYLCRLIVERSFGGRVWLERTGSEGSSFRFTVPAADVPRHRRQAGSMPKQLH